MPVKFTPAPVVYKSLDFLSHPDYRVGDDGSVWSRYRNPRNPRGDWRRLSPQPCGAKDSTGQYLSIALNKKCRHYVHHLVLLAFVGPRPAGQEARHLNGVRTDNRPENLAWATHRENVADRSLHGTEIRGERHWRSKLTAVQVREIRRLASLGHSHRIIAGQFHVTREAVTRIVSRVNWKHVV